MTGIKELLLGERTFYLHTYHPLAALRVEANLISLGAGPILGMVAAMARAPGKPVQEVAPQMLSALAGIDPDKVQQVFMMLLDPEVVAVRMSPHGSPEKLTATNLEIVFRGRLADMHIVAFEVLRHNFTDFIVDLGKRFGAAVSAGQPPQVPAN